MMYESDPIRLVQALVGAEMKVEGGAGDDEIGRAPVVTISRDYGAGGRSVARRLAERLEVPVYDRELLDRVVESAKTHHYLFERLDEKVESRMSDWMHTLVSGRSAFREDYRKHLISVVLGLAGTGGIIVGRGAHLILDDRQAFRARVVGSPEECARRVARAEGCPIEEAEKRVFRTNAERAEAIRLLFGRDLRDATTYDLVINSNRFGPDAIAEMIVSAMRAAGFQVPEHART